MIKPTSLLSLIKTLNFTKGKHILGVGCVQCGKTAFMRECMVYIQQHLKRPIIILTRNSIDERSQLTDRIDRMNENLSNTFQYESITATSQILRRQFIQRKGIVAIAHHTYISALNEVLTSMSLTAVNYRAPIIIHDEADTLNTDTEEENRLVTDNLYKRLVELAFCRISITATPMSPLVWDNIDQVIAIPHQKNYYGFEKLKHVVVNTVRSSDSKIEYCPDSDKENLAQIMDANLQTRQSMFDYNFVKNCRPSPDN